MSTPDPEILEKIKKLMRVDPTRGSTKEEAEAAMSMAMKLAAKHHLDISQIDATEITAAGEPFVSEEYEVRYQDGTRKGELMRKVPAASKWVRRLLGEFFRVDMLFSHKLQEEIVFNGKPMPSAWCPVFTIHGRKTDVAIAIYVYGFLQAEFKRQWNEYLAKNPDLQMSDRNGFFSGLYYGLRDKLSTEQRNVEKEVQKTLDVNAGTSTAIVLLKEDEKREASLKDQHPRIRYVQTDYGSVNNYSAHDEGRARGKKIKITTALDQ